MRNIFINKLIEHASRSDSIMLLVGDLGYSVIEPFEQKFPKSFLNVGVAEQNMATIAAGLASEGKHVFIYSIGNFSTFRCAEQIRNDIAYHELPVTVVAVGGGLGYGALGYSHHAIQDYALMRSFPGVTILSPGDDIELQACMEYIISEPHPSYLRLPKIAPTKIHIDELDPLSLTKPVEIKCSNNSSAILTTGGGLQLVASELNEISLYDVYSIPVWGMSHRSSLFPLLKSYKKIVTIEDHLKDAGFGSWVLETIASNDEVRSSVDCKIIGLDSKVCGKVGNEKTLWKIGEISPLKPLLC